MKSVGFLVSGCIISLFVAFPAFAVSINISSPTTTVNADQEVVLHTSVAANVANGTTYYLRGVFYKNTKSVSCGYTWNNASWYNGPISTTCQQYLPITITNNSWTGDMRVKVDLHDSSCQTSDTYSLTVERLTTNCSGSYDGNTLSIALVMPTKLPTLTPTSPPTPTQAPHASTPKPQSFFSTIPQADPTNIPEVLQTHEQISERTTVQDSVAPSFYTATSTAIAIATVSASATASATVSTKLEQQSVKKGEILGSSAVSKKTTPQPIFLVIFGIMLLISAGGIVFFLKKRHAKL